MESENHWYFIVDDGEERHQEGPVSSGDIAEMLSAGKLSTETLVWRDGMITWLKIAVVPDFSQPSQNNSPPHASTSIAAEPSGACRPEGSAKSPSDTVTIKELDNHTIKFSKSRNVLLIATNDYHAGPLVLTKLDLLGFLTAMESTDQQNKSK